MKDIFKILSDFGFDVPEDKKAEFKKVVLENYKTINEFEHLNDKITDLETKNTELQEKYNTDIQQRDTDLSDLKKQLEEAGNSQEALNALQEKFETLSTDYATAKSDYEQKLKKQNYEFLIKEAANGLNFSSNSAKKAFIMDALEKELTVADGKLIGFNDFVDLYKNNDADAFKAETPPEPEPKPIFSGKTGTMPSNPTDSNMSSPVPLII